jgi:hypothetical protein
MMAAYRGFLRDMERRGSASHHPVLAGALGQIHGLIGSLDGVFTGFSGG